MPDQNQEIRPESRLQKNLIDLKDIRLPVKSNIDVLESMVNNYGSERRVDYEEMSGNSDIGTIRVLKQIHTTKKTPPIEYQEIGAYQAEILKILLEEKPTHIFDEGLLEDTIRGDASYLITPDSAPLIEEIKKTGTLPDNLTENDYFELAKNRAGVLYKILNPDSVIHPYTTAQESNDFEEILKNHPEREKEIVMDHREKLTISSIMSFLGTNPGSEVFLIYGAGHKWGPEDFDDSFKNSEKRPVIKSTFFPGLASLCSDRISLFTLTENYPKLQSTLIKKSNCIHPYSLSHIKDYNNFTNAFLKSRSYDFTNNVILNLFNELSESPEKQAFLAKNLERIPVFALSLIKSTNLINDIIETSNLHNTGNDYLIMAEKIEDPVLEFKILSTLAIINPEIEYFVDSDESKALTVIRNPAKYSVTNLDYYLNNPNESVADFIKTTDHLSPKIFPKLNSPELQVEALEKMVTQMNNREYYAYGKSYFMQHALNEEVEHSIDKLSTKLFNFESITRPRTSISSITELAEELVLFNDSNSNQKLIVESQESIPIIVLESIPYPDVLELAVNKIKRPSKIELEGINLDMMLSNNPAIEPHLKTLIALIKPSKKQIHNLLKRQDLAEDIKLELLHKSDHLDFDALLWLRSEKLQLMAIEKIAPPETRSEYITAEYQLENKALKTFKARFPFAPK